MAANQDSNPNSTATEDDHYQNQSNSGTGATATILAILAVLVIGAVVIFSGGDGENMGDIDPAAVVSRSAVNASGTQATGSAADVGDDVTITRGELADRTDLVRNQVQSQLDALENSTTSNPQAQAQIQQLNSLLENETQLNQTVLTSILDQTLLVLAAEDAGISVTEEEVDSQLSQQIEQIGGEEEFESRLNETGQTRELVREDVRDQLYVQRYLEQSTTDSEAEINELYNQYRDRLSQLSSSTDSLPSLEQLRPQIEAQISQQNRQELLSQARENYTVEVFVDGVMYPPAPAGQAPAAQPQSTSTGSATATPTVN